MNKYEAEIAETALHPSEISTKFSGQSPYQSNAHSFIFFFVMSFLDIGGHEEVIAVLKRNLTTVLSQPKEKLLQAPIGILLYGPPGCGKTLLAKAIAKEVDLRFLIFPLSLILDKWVGETEKYMEALFSLARKIAPCIIFIDEIDALTRKRSPMDRDWNLTMKSHFLSLWDGICSADLNSKIIVNITLFILCFVNIIFCRFWVLQTVNSTSMKRFCVACHYKSKSLFPTLISGKILLKL